MSKRTVMSGMQKAQRPWALKPWWQKVRQHLKVSEQDGQLVMQRRWQPHAIGFFVCALPTVIATWLSWTDPIWEHHPAFLLCLHLFFPLLLVSIPIFYARRYWSRSRVFVFDRVRDYVTCDDRVVCALSEIQSVRVGSPLGWEVEMKGLGFIIHGRNEVEIERDDLLGAGLSELGQAGLTLSNYAQVPFWAEGAWYDPHGSWNPPAPLDPTRPLRSISTGRSSK